MSLRTLLALAAGLFVACASIQGTIPQRKTLATGGCSGFVAGAARGDLTPPPGFPLGGFSIESRMSRGAWTPLQARAIYLRDAGCEAAVLVSTDLMILPNGLADRVADKLGRDDATAHIGRENLLLTATENHLSPGNFFSSRLYNAYASHIAGFDPDLFEFLADRIARTIRDAVAAQQPARLRTGHSSIPGVFRNRALGAFLRNREALDFLTKAPASGASRCPALPYASHPLASPERFHELACLAVTPRVDVIEVLDVSGSKRIALAGFLATHTTVLPAAVEVYAADLLGFTALRMERGELPTACASDGSFPVVALFNGAQGDVTTQWTTRDRGDLLNLSDAIGEGLCSALPGANEPSPKLAFQYEEITRLTDVAFEDPFDGQKYAHDTPTRPEGGVAELGGAADGRTIFYELAHREEITSFRRTQHGSKIAPMTFDLGRFRVSLGSAEFKSNPPPAKAPLTILRIGETVLVGVPGEMTTMMGARTRALVGMQQGIDPERVVLVGFGNGHVSYFPTTEEYDAQHYEGASDYYGPGTGAYLAVKLAELAKALPSPSTRLEARDYAYKTGPKRRFRPRGVGHAAYHPDDGNTRIVEALDPGEAAPVVVGTTEPRTPKRDFPTWCFLDALPRLDLLSENEDPDNEVCLRNLPQVAIHKAGSDAVAVVDGRVQDSGGSEIVTVLAAAGMDRGEWCATWLAPVEVDGGGNPTNLDTSYEFRIRGITARASDPPWRSAPFSLSKGFVQDDPLSLTCSNFAAQDVAVVGGIFTERARCTPLDRPPCHAMLEMLGLCDFRIDYCKAP